MKTLSIEIHYFSSITTNISTTDAFNVMSEIKELELFAQKYQEALPGGNPEQRFMFTNGVSGLTIRCQRDRILMTQGVNPNSDSSEFKVFKDTLSQLCKIMNRFVVALETVLGKKQSFCRLAVVSRHIEQDKFKEFLSNLNNIAANNLPWAEHSSKELLFRTGHRFTFTTDDNNEIFNEIVLVNDGVIDMSTNGVSVSVTPCILVEIDINSIPENVSERFNIENIEPFINTICERQHNTLSKIQGYVERA
ncbi:hypothetical protein [Aeromonas enteropelogenes]|uniref:hypothetical protein n=1 Tax=Aeromonas enteropelogenes TaxID=29489 RepID=UPI0022857E99|nr:hypothetical protein [Aeromonas enteropelogenes]MCZ0750093.1 hypothetical protein [Aeromonas enteropelogenes]